MSSPLFDLSLNQFVRIESVAAILLTGLSRPYLGVHYLGDVLFGWLLGGAVAGLAYRSSDAIGELWSRRPTALRGLGLVMASAAIWFGTSPFYVGHPQGPPLAVASYLGLVSRVLVGQPIEARRYDFDPREGGVARKTYRFSVTVLCVMGCLIALDLGFEQVAGEASTGGMILGYLRYLAAGTSGICLAPFLFARASRRG